MFLSVVVATGLSYDGDVRAVTAEVEFLAPLAFLGGAYPPDFSFLLWSEAWPGGFRGGLALGGGWGFPARLGGFAFGARVAGVIRLGEDENVVEGTAYCPRVRAALR